MTSQAGEEEVIFAEENPVIGGKCTQSRANKANPKVIQRIFLIQDQHSPVDAITARRRNREKQENAGRRRPDS